MLLLPHEEQRNALRERLRLQRRDMAVILALRNVERNGHSCLPVEKIITAASGQLRKSRSVMGKDSCTAEDLTDMAQRGLLVPEEVNGVACYYIAELHAVEREVACCLRALASSPPPWSASSTDHRPAWVDDLNDFASLSAQQRDMAKELLASKMAILTGGPGTGKTTLLRCLVQALQNNGQRVLLCSPTGRASRRLSEATGKDASTVHKAVAVGAPAYADVVIVDEASVLDVRVLLRLLKQMPEHATLYFVGDADQLPPVGPSHVLQALLDTSLVPVHRLTEVHRQVRGGESGGKNPLASCLLLRRASPALTLPPFLLQATASDLVEIARRFNTGTFIKVPHHCHDLTSGSDFAFVSCSTDDRLDMIEQLVTKEVRVRRRRPLLLLLPCLAVPF